MAHSLSAVPAPNGASYGGTSLADLPKSWNFTSSLPPDPLFPTPAASHQTPRADIGPRLVKGALFTWVRPTEAKDPELLSVSSAAMKALGIREGEEKGEEFKQLVAGNRLLSWDEETGEGGYPWATCYGGGIDTDNYSCPCWTDNA